jgi:hypothetical protein
MLQNEYNLSPNTSSKKTQQRIIKEDNVIGRFRTVLVFAAGIALGVGIALTFREYGSMAQTSGGCQAFAQTSHKVCGKFLDYWQKHGGLAQQGYPLSEEFTETSALNGKPYTVQYFERAVFELHPENKPPFDVLLSQLGTYVGNESYTKGFPTVAGEVPFYENRATGITTLKSYYNAINRKEYDRAYSYFQGAPNPDSSVAPPYQQFVAGYNDTVSVVLAVGKESVGAGAGNLYSSIPAVITATHTDKSTVVFSGCYFLHRVNNVDGAKFQDLLWSVISAKLAPAPANTQVDTLLAQQCVR